MERVLESLIPLAVPIALFAFAGVVLHLLPDAWRPSLMRWRGVVAAGFFVSLAAVAIGFGVAILTTDDHMGAATPEDAYVAGPFLMVLGLMILGFAVAAYRNNPLR